MENREHPLPPYKGFVKCEVHEHPAYRVVRGGCIETGPEVLGCVSLPNGNIGLIVLRHECDLPDDCVSDVPETPGDQPDRLDQ